MHLASGSRTYKQYRQTDNEWLVHGATVYCYRGLMWITLSVPIQVVVDRTCTGSLLQCPFSDLQCTHAVCTIHDDVKSAAEQEVVFSPRGSQT